MAFQSELSPATGSFTNTQYAAERPVQRLVDLSLLTSMRINFLQIRSGQPSCNRLAV
jgi:hypothetical protein